MIFYNLLFAKFLTQIIVIFIFIFVTPTRMSSFLLPFITNHALVNFHELCNSV